MSDARITDQEASHAGARIARWLLYATLLVPVVVFPGFFFPFVTIRAVYFRVLVEIATALLLYLALRREASANFRRDVVFWAFFAWVCANILAAVLGPAPMRSIFGDHERMGGVWFWVHLLAFYVALRTFFRESDWWRFFRLAVVIGSAVAVYGLVQYQFGLFTSRIGGIDAGVTIGNPGLMAPYLLANVGLCGLLGVRSRGFARYMYVALAVLLITGLFFSGNRSSMLALLLGTGAALLAYVLWSQSLRGRSLTGVVVLLVASAALVMVSRAPWAGLATSPVPAIARLSGGVDSARVVQWQAAVDGIRDRPIFGFGPENYPIIWSRFYHPEMYRFVIDSRWDRAHNAYLDAFAMTGIFGFLALLAIWVALGWAGTNSAMSTLDQKAPGKERAIDAIALGLSVAYAFYLLFWFFDLNSTMLWVALAGYVASRSIAQPLITFGAPRERRWQTNLVLAAGGLAVTAVLYVHGFETLRMARTLDAVQRPGRPPEQVLKDYESVFDSPAPVTQHAFVMYANHLSSFRPRFGEIRNDVPRAALFDRAFILAIHEFERQAIQDPLNERITAQHARVLILGAYYYDNPRLYESALMRLRRAVELAPRRIPTHWALGMAYLNVQRPRDALKAFESAYAQYPPLGPTQAYLGLAHSALGENREAARWLSGALHFGHVPARLLVTGAARALAAEGNPATGADLLRLYLATKSGPAFTRVPRSPGALLDYQTAKLASDLFEAGGDSAAAAAFDISSDMLCARELPLDLLANNGVHEPIIVAADCRQPWRSTERY